MRFLGALVALLAACHNHGTAPPTCEAVSDHVLSLIEPKDDRAHKIHDAFAKRCHDDKWSGEVLKCIASEPQLGSGHHCLDKLDSEQRSALSRALTAAEKPDLPAECDTYKASITRLTKCDKIPQATRDAYKAQYDQQSSTWDARTRANVASMASICRDNGQGIDQMLRGIGC